MEHRHGTVAELLGLAEPSDDRLVARVHTVSKPALVLGSSQGPQTVDMARAESAGVEVLRRRSGGGAVLVAPRRQVWVDFFVPNSSFLWHDDVARAAWWAGELWASVASLFTAATPSVHFGGFEADRWGRLVCFAGVGPGEVLISGRKTVGVSQRRNRQRVRLQTSALVSMPSVAGSAEAVGQAGAAGADRPLGTLRPACCGRGGIPEPMRSAESSALDELELMALTSWDRAAGRAAVAKRCAALAADASSVTDALLDMLGVRGSPSR